MSEKSETTDAVCGCDGYFDEGCPACTPKAEDEYPRGITVRDHIAHDMRAGRFPKRSSIETFLKERRAAALSRLAELDGEHL